ncbi:redox-regulated ATPase YchF [Candidatus Microgenomates bacterium]|jgi:GTP-binding protein YchF|nr:MAG: redox-regulated ATPase YchF [Candidatus Microgenomates bacterium]
MLTIGIVGLPNAGKSTLFNALLSRQIASCAPYPFCTIDPNIGVVEVPDRRLEFLAETIASQNSKPQILNSKQTPNSNIQFPNKDNWPPIVPAIVEFKDIAGLVAGAAKGEGLGNKFLSHIRESAAILHVLRGFEDPNVVREGNIDPQGDFEIIKTELCLADLQTLEKQHEPNFSVATKEDKLRWEAVLKVRRALEEGIEVRNTNLTEEEKEIIKPLFLLTAKPALFVLNIDEKDIGLTNKELGEKFGLVEDENLIPICAKVEMELSELPFEERKEYLKELGLVESGLERLIKKGFEILGMQTFLTAGEKEVRAWTVRKGAKAPEAAGVIHTDFEKGFIKAQVVGFEDFVKYGGWKGAAEAGKVRLEGKEYVVNENDVIEFKFNV